MTWDEPKIRPKRRWVGMTIALVVFLALVVATLVIGEKLGRDFATGLVKDQIGGALGVESDESVTVDLGGGSLIAQAIGGGLDGVHITADGVPIGDASTDIELSATGVPLDPGGSIDTLAATVILDAEALLALGASLTDSPLTAVEFADGAIVLSTTTAAFGTEVPATVAMTPSAVDGVVAFTVTAMTVNAEAVDVAAAQAGAYGPGAAAAATPRSLCVSGFLPAALVLEDATVAGDSLVLGLRGTNVPLSGGLTSRGECA